MKRTLSDATDALAHVEARANAELAAPPPRVVVPPVEGELAVLDGAPEGGPEGGDGPAIEIDLEVETEVDLVEPEAPTADDHRPDAEDSGAAVDALFARLRASHTVDAAPGEPLPEPAAEETSEPEPEPEPAEPGSEPEPEAAVAEVPAPMPTAPEPAPRDETTEPEPAAGEASEQSAPDEPLSPDDALRAARAEVLEPLSKDLGRRAKRALQDQQNELLDRIRTIKGKVEADAVLPSTEEQEAAWTPVLVEPLGAAYARAYSELAPNRASPKPEVPRDLLDELSRSMVEPWRQRLVSAIDGAGDDTEQITQRLGSRYREYRGRELEDALGDALAAAWARGAYAAVPDGTLLRWVPAEVGLCPDCDDNALEVTARSEPFPTGQVFPPAHTGCRCFLALAGTTPAKPTKKKKE